MLKSKVIQNVLQLSDWSEIFFGQYQNFVLNNVVTSNLVSDEVFGPKNGWPKKPYFLKLLLKCFWAIKCATVVGLE